MNTSLAALIRKTGFRFGIMLGLVSAALFFTFVLLALKTNGWVFSLAGYIFSAVFIVLAHLYFKENNEGTMTFGQGVSISFWTGLPAGVLSSLISYIYMKFVNAKFVTEMVEVLRTDMEKRGMPDDQIDTALNISAKFMTPEVILFSGILSTILYAVLIGLVVSIFTKKNSAVPAF